MSERFILPREGCDLAGERWPGHAQLVVLLHEGVADRRGWHQMAERLAPQVTVVAYDRRGYGESPVSTAPFTHVGDLLAVLGQEGAERAWLVGASAGGGLALDAALLAPDRVAGLVLIGTARFFLVLGCQLSPSIVLAARESHRSHRPTSPGHRGSARGAPHDEGPRR